MAAVFWDQKDIVRLARCPMSLCGWFVAARCRFRGLGFAARSNYAKQTGLPAFSGGYRCVFVDDAILRLASGM